MIEWASETKSKEGRQMSCGNCDEFSSCRGRKCLQSVGGSVAFPSQNENHEFK